LRKTASATGLQLDSVPVGLGRHPCQSAEECGEAALVLVADAQPNINQRQFIVRQQPLGFLHPAVDHIPVRRYAGRLSERAGEVRTLIPPSSFEPSVTKNKRVKPPSEGGFTPSYTITQRTASERSGAQPARSLQAASRTRPAFAARTREVGPIAITIRGINPKRMGAMPP
jgi:hypothetical protein